MRNRPLAAPLALSLILCAGPAWAADEPTADEPDATEPDATDPPGVSAAELQLLRDELELMKLRMEAMESMPSEAASPPAASPNVFNPRITGFIDMIGAVGLAAGGVHPYFDVRAFELDFRADIDPFAKAVVVLGFENPLLAALQAEAEGAPPATPEEIGEAWLSVVEEANITFVALPAHLLLELGVVRMDFGGLNRMHLHDVPHPNYPGALTALLGEEGWADAGAFLRYRLHNPRSLPIDLKVGVMARGPEPLMEGRQTPTPVLMGRLSASADFGSGSLLSGGASYAGWRDATADPRGFHLASADFLLKVRPPRRGQYTSLFVQGEAYFANRLGAEGRNTLAGFVGVGVQPARSVFLSLRADALVDDLSAPSVAWGGGFAASMYTTEFLRLRLSYDVLAQQTVSHRFGLQVTAVFGSHPVEPYWVNR